jgi:hypothetical protein
MTETSSEQKTPVLDALREWGFDPKTFEARAKKSLQSARGDLSEITEAVRQTLANTKRVLIELEKQKAPVAAELKKGFEEAWDAIERGFGRARQKVRETKDEESGTESHPS